MDAEAVVPGPEEEEEDSAASFIVTLLFVILSQCPTVCLLSRANELYVRSAHLTLIGADSQTASALAAAAPAGSGSRSQRVYAAGAFRQ